jgi:hypothetical protein
MQASNFDREELSCRRVVVRHNAAYPPPGMIVQNLTLFLGHSGQYCTEYVLSGRSAYQIGTGEGL